MSFKFKPRTWTKLNNFDARKGKLCCGRKHYDKCHLKSSTHCPLNCLRHLRILLLQLTARHFLQPNVYLRPFFLQLRERLDPLSAVPADQYDEPFGTYRRSVCKGIIFQPSMIKGYLVRLKRLPFCGITWVEPQELWYFANSLQQEVPM